MRTILTHEQADFDAVASLLGAYLLDDEAVPVLPYRINRNVRAFITLYGIELPFYEARDLPNETIQTVTLVDTQSLTSLKGMEPKMRVHVIDHHPLRENLPGDWTIQTPELGATTTYLVELLRETNGALTLVQATLLLLGIYEDTGSLTYTRTTARDLRAAAYLLEIGASLQIANNFLNHPLTPDQQALYDLLRANTETIKIHGHSIVLACGDASEVEEELSTIAHKLRDLLDPDALFLLVKTRGGIQLIARSSTDRIDVAEISTHFGGGGHDRAAASLIRGKELEDVCQELLNILPDFVHPAVTVAEIMSRHPQLLSPDSPVEMADERMKRFGYEGYPVVEETQSSHGKQTKVVGLLTRRAVDKALAHKLTRSVSQIMEAGEVTIYPEDSIEVLQRRMIDTGWGQIPVVDASNGDILGIVTRTDLLKILTPEPRLPERSHLVSQLEAALPSERLELLKTIASMAHDQQAALYVVGGFVRDLLLEQPSLDFDLVVEGDAIELARSLAKKWGGRVTSHSQFGTAKWHLKGSCFENLNGNKRLEAVDLVSARTEFYTYPTALPTIERGSIKLDLHRRDFTINTLALRLDGRHYGELHDYWGGLGDLHQKFVRVLHSLSFVDDPTRILRAVRFEQRFDFHIEPRTLELLLEARTMIERLSGDRIRHELNHILASTNSGMILKRLNELGLFMMIHSRLVWDSWLAEKINHQPDTFPDVDWELVQYDSIQDLRQDLGYCLWMIRLKPSDARSVCRRLKISATLSRQILSACQLWGNSNKLNFDLPSLIITQLETSTPLARYALYLATDEPEIRKKLENYAHTWRYISPSVNGHDLRALGLPPGPIYREVLELLRFAWLDEKVTSEDEETILLRELINAAQSRE